MKKYLKMMPLFVYPYAYLIFIITMIVCSVNSEQGSINDTLFTFLVLLAVFYNIVCLVLVILNAILGACGKYTIQESARINMLVKCIQIPGYILNFIISLIAMLMSIWGIGIILLEIVVDLLTITLTGISSLGLTLRLMKEKTVKKKHGILLLIGSFIYVIDVIIAVSIVLALDGKILKDKLQKQKEVTM